MGNENSQCNNESDGCKTLNYYDECYDDECKIPNNLNCNHYNEPETEKKRKKKNNNIMIRELYDHDDDDDNETNTTKTNNEMFDDDIPVQIVVVSTKKSNQFDEEEDLFSDISEKGEVDDLFEIQPSTFCDENIENKKKYTEKQVSSQNMNNMNSDAVILQNNFLLNFSKKFNKSSSQSNTNVIRSNSENNDTPSSQTENENDDDDDYLTIHPSSSSNVTFPSSIQALQPFIGDKNVMEDENIFLEEYNKNEQTSFNNKYNSITSTLKKINNERLKRYTKTVNTLDDDVLSYNDKNYIVCDSDIDQFTTNSSSARKPSSSSPLSSPTVFCAKEEAELMTCIQNSRENFGSKDFRTLPPLLHCFSAVQTLKQCSKFNIIGK